MNLIISFVTAAARWLFRTPVVRDHTGCREAAGLRVGWESGYMSRQPQVRTGCLFLSQRLSPDHIRSFWQTAIRHCHECDISRHPFKPSHPVLSLQISFHTEEHLPPCKAGFLENNKAECRRKKERTHIASTSFHQYFSLGR